jgi:glycosyltransferase involved in cell wall biosynthesis
MDVQGRLRRIARGIYHYYLQHGRLTLRRGVGLLGVHSLDPHPLSDPQIGLVVVEDTRQFSFAIRLAKRAGKPVLALPHNLESLYFARESATAPAVTGRKFGYEASVLKQADAVVCIAREEQWLLRCAGIDAAYLPYFPPGQLGDQFRAVRAARRSVADGPAVILGYAGNRPNRLGMENLLRHLARSSPDPGRETVVVGYGTDYLRNHPSIVGVRILGELSDPEFLTLLTKARAVVVHQEYGAGSLTKITEMLLAGVPIIASETAARSHSVPEPPPPVAAEDRFVSLVRTLCGPVA